MWRTKGRYHARTFLQRGVCRDTSIRLPSVVADRVGDIFGEILEDTHGEHLRDAEKAGLFDITLETLRQFRGQIRDMDEKDIHALLRFIWICNASRLTRALSF